MVTELAIREDLLQWTCAIAAKQTEVAVWSMHNAREMGEAHVTRTS